MSSELRTIRLSVRTVLLVTFILVSSGPFGVEEMVSASGPGATLLLLLAIPVVWGVPFSLMCAELASAIPSEGGAYVWIDRGLGRFWAFQSGWWSTLSGMVDTALYAVLAASYANSFLGWPALAQWLMAVAVIAVFAAMNVRSLATMAFSSASFSIVILAPCLALTVLGIHHWSRDPFGPLVPPGESWATSLGLGLTVAIWFYSGYESLSTMAGEIAEPQRVIPRALLLSMPAVVGAYILPTAAGLASVGRWEEWGSEAGRTTLVQVARELGGPALGIPMMAAALVSSLALYNAYLAAGARTTLVMGEAGLLPRVFARVHARFGTPHASIWIAAALHALLAVGSFAALLVIDVFLFVMSYLLIFAAWVALRVKEPRLGRPYRVPVDGAPGLALVAGVPALVGLVALGANGVSYVVYGSLAAATGLVAYPVLRRGAALNSPALPSLAPRATSRSKDDSPRDA